MKKKIIIISVIVVVLVVIGITIFSKKEKQNDQEELSVKLYTNNLEIELTPEQQKQIIIFYKRTNKRKEDVQSAIGRMVELEFSDGNTILFGNEKGKHALYNGEYRIRLANGFRQIHPHRSVWGRKNKRINRQKTWAEFI